MPRRGLYSALAMALPVAVALAMALPVAVALAMALPVAVALAVALPVAVALAVALASALAVALASALAGRSLGPGLLLGLGLDHLRVAKVLGLVPRGLLVKDLDRERARAGLRAEDSGADEPRGGWDGGGARQAHVEQ